MAEVVGFDDKVKNNLNQISIAVQNFALRYLVLERVESWNTSWLSEKNMTRRVWDKPKLQYTLDGVEWIDVPTVCIKE